MELRRGETHCSPRTFYGTRRISEGIKPTVALEYFIQLVRRKSCKLYTSS